MSSDLGHLFESALSLPDGQRADLAFQLLGSLKPPSSLSDSEPELGEEVRRRLESLDSGTSTVSELDDVDRRIRNTLKDRKSS